MEMSFHKKVASKNYPKVQLVGFYRGLCLENWKLRKLVVYDQKASQKGNHSELWKCSTAKYVVSNCQKCCAAPVPVGVSTRKTIHLRQYCEPNPALDQLWGIRFEYEASNAIAFQMGQWSCMGQHGFYRIEGPFCLSRERNFLGVPAWQVNERPQLGMRRWQQLSIPGNRCNSFTDSGIDSLWWHRLYRAQTKLHGSRLDARRNQGLRHQNNIGQVERNGV